MILKVKEPVVLSRRDRSFKGCAKVTKEEFDINRLDCEGILTSSAA
jgi:hypothetical protein